MKRVWTRTLLVVAFLTFARGGQAQNLIVNGGFDNGYSGWNGTFGLYSGTINPAALSANTVAVLDGGEPQMFQDFPTVPGLTYEVDWGMRLPDLDGGGIPIVGESTVGPGELSVVLNGQLTQYLVQNRTTWGFGTLHFVATGASSELSFWVQQYLNGGQRSESVFLDNVSAVVVPEPSWALLMIGGTILFLVRWLWGRPSLGSLWKAV